MSGAGPRDGRTAGLRRQAGRDDGRMYGCSDAGYQARLKKLTAQQQEWNATATAAHEAAQTELFKKGVAAKNNTADQTACIGKLLSDIQQNKELPLVLAVRRWTSGMMGRAAKAVHSHGYGIVFLGDCAEVVDLAGTKNRTSVCIAQHWLHGAFPDRKGQFKQKRDARDALAEEIKTARLGRQVCFIDASVIGFSRYDWEEAQKVSAECDAVIVVSVDSQATATLPAVKKRKPRKSERATQPSSSQPSVRQRAVAAHAFVSSSAHAMSTLLTRRKLSQPRKADAVWLQLGYQDGSDHVCGLAG